MTWKLQRTLAIDPLNAISCDLPKLSTWTTCVAVGSRAGGASAQLSFTGGRDWTSQTPIAGTAAMLFYVSCPASARCVAVGRKDLSGEGEALTADFRAATRVASTECADVAMVTARGTDEPYTADPFAQEVGSAARALARVLPRTTYRVIPAPFPTKFQALLPNVDDYLREFDLGQNIVTRIVKNMAEACHRQQDVVIGYSMGAGVMDLAATKLQATPVGATHHVAAEWVSHVTLLADPLRLPQRSIDRSVVVSPWPKNVPPLKNWEKSLYNREPGIAADLLGGRWREQLPSALTRLEHGWTRTVSWCATGDAICAFPGTWDPKVLLTGRSSWLGRVCRR